MNHCQCSKKNYAYVYTVPVRVVFFLTTVIQHDKPHAILSSQSRIEKVWIPSHLFLLFFLYHVKKSVLDLHLAQNLLLYVTKSQWAFETWAQFMVFCPFRDRIHKYSRVCIDRQDDITIDDKMWCLRRSQENHQKQMNG